jgi:hypothetical protein
MLQPDDTDHFLDQIGGAVDVAPPCRHGHGPVLRDDEAERLQNRALPLHRHIHPAQCGGQPGVEAQGARLQRRGSGAGDGAGVAAAMLQHQPRRDGEAIVKERRIDPALEPLAGVAGQHQRLAGASDMFRIEIGALDQHVARRL